MSEGKLAEVTKRLYAFNADGIAFLAAKPGDLLPEAEVAELEKSTKAYREGREPFAKMQAKAAGQVQRKAEAPKVDQPTTPLVEPAESNVPFVVHGPDAHLGVPHAHDEAGEPYVVNAEAAKNAKPADGEKPIDKLTVAELKARAAELKVDVKGLRKAKDLRKAIKQATK